MNAAARDQLKVLPTILWKVDDFSSGDKKLCRSLSFLDMNWKLKLLCLPEVGGLKLKVVLKRVGPAIISRDVNFVVETSILSHDSFDQYFTQTIKANVQYREWSIWSQFKSDIEQQEHVNYRRGLLFLIVVTPGDKCSVFLQPTYKKQLEKVNPCLQALSKDLSSILDRDVHTDVVVVCGSQTFRAHRSILSARSKVFKAMFSTDIVEVIVSDVTLDIFQMFLKYLYSGDIQKLSTTDARRLFNVAEKYAVDSLKIKCASVITESYRCGAETELPLCGPFNVVYLTAQEKEILRCKELTSDVLLTKDWRILEQECPKLATDMFRPLMVESPPPPIESPPHPVESRPHPFEFLPSQEEETISDTSMEC